MAVGDPILRVYVFKRAVPKTYGPLEDRDKYYVYATSKEAAFQQYKDENEQLTKLGIEPTYLGRRRT